MMSVTARLIWLAAAAWPIARPSPKLCTPMPIAMSSASCFPGVSVSSHVRCSNSSLAAAPGADERASRGGRSGAFIHSE